ncbi:hypothetical protein [Streptomyces sp. NPDC088812]
MNDHRPLAPVTAASSGTPPHSAKAALHGRPARPGTAPGDEDR